MQRAVACTLFVSVKYSPKNPSNPIVGSKGKCTGSFLPALQTAMQRASAHFLLGSGEPILRKAVLISNVKSHCSTRFNRVTFVCPQTAMQRAFARILFGAADPSDKQLTVTSVTEFTRACREIQAMLGEHATIYGGSFPRNLPLVQLTGTSLYRQVRGATGRREPISDFDTGCSRRSCCVLLLRQY